MPRSAPPCPSQQGRSAWRAPSASSSGALSPPPFPQPVPSSPSHRPDDVTTCASADETEFAAPPFPSPPAHFSLHRRNNARVNVTRVQCSVVEICTVRMNGRTRSATRTCGAPCDLTASAPGGGGGPKRGGPLRIASRGQCDEADVPVLVQLDGRVHPDCRLQNVTVEHRLVVAFHTDVRLRLRMRMRLSGGTRSQARTRPGRVCCAAGVTVNRCVVSRLGSGAGWVRVAENRALRNPDLLLRPPIRRAAALRTAPAPDPACTSGHRDDSDSRARHRLRWAEPRALSPASSLLLCRPRRAEAGQLRRERIRRALSLPGHRRRRGDAASGRQRRRAWPEGDAAAAARQRSG